jgi:hypothetical protein
MNNDVQIKVPVTTKPLCSRRQVSISGFRALLSGILFLQGCASGGSSYTPPEPGKLPKNMRARSQVSAVPLNFDVGEGFEKLNAIRANRLLPQFRQDPRLQRAAQDYANLMGTKGLYGLDIGPGTDFRSRIFAVGYDNSSGENLGVGYRSIDEALAGWLKSPDHKRNMMKPNYTLAGLAYGFNRSGKNPRFTHYWVLIMGQAEKT